MQALREASKPPCQMSDSNVDRDINRLVLLADCTTFNGISPRVFISMSVREHMLVSSFRQSEISDLPVKCQ